MIIYYKNQRNVKLNAIVCVSQNKPHIIHKRHHSGSFFSDAPLARQSKPASRTRLGPPPPSSSTLPPPSHCHRSKGLGGFTFRAAVSRAFPSCCLSGRCIGSWNSPEHTGRTGAHIFAHVLHILHTFCVFCTLHAICVCLLFFLAKKAYFPHVPCYILII